jgi:beta-N-acetylhexosaminidase
MGKIISSIIIPALLILGCSKPAALKTNDSELILKDMSLDNKIGQMLVVAMPGGVINPEAKKIIESYKPGGVIFFGFNVSRKNQIRRFVTDLQEYSMQKSGIPLLVTIDQEGGRVHRIEDGVTRFPGAMSSGVSGDPRLVYEMARITGMELKLLGVNMNLAPDLDVNNNPDNPVINTRSFGSDVDVVSKMGVEYIKGLQDSGCAAVGKHFPGHGDTNRDSHYTLPVINYDMDRLKKIEFVPFIKSLNSDVSSIMTAHVSYPKILGNDDSATVSKKFLTDILRGEFGFRGVVMTDAIEMDAISKRMDLGEASVKSIEAGTDIILITSYGSNIGTIHAAIKSAVLKGKISSARIDASVKRILDLKLKYKIMAYKNGTTSLVPAAYSEKEMKLLEKAPEINSRLSRAAIYYYGEDAVLKGDDRKRIFISDNKILRENLIKSENALVYDSIWRINAAEVKKLKGEKVSLYFFIDEPLAGTLSSINDYCAGKKYDLVVVSAGNPFPIARLQYIKSVLCSFSNTEESIRQLALCLNGEFKPKKNINYYIGFGEKK